MLSHLAQKLWGEFESRQECFKFIRLAAILAFTIGIYWIINPTKDTVFIHTVGINYLPYAKMFSLIIMVPVIMLYGRLIDFFPRHKIFYVLCLTYALGACLFGFLIIHPTIGIANTVLGKWRLIGWAWYAFVESFGSIMVALFWSFAADTSTPESAKRGFSIIALGAQMGGVLGPLLFRNAASTWGPAPFPFIAAGGMAVIAGLVFYFMWITPATQLAGYHQSQQTNADEEKYAGFFEGLGLIGSSWYLLGITAIVMLYEVTTTILEFHVKTLAQMTYCSINDLNCFFFNYAIYANGIALVSLLCGAGAIGRKLGLQRTLVLLPLLVLIGLIAVGIRFDLITTLTVFIVVRGLNYALNQPAKEQLYIPTGRQSRYKAKAWIDMFGSRMAKGMGSSVHILRPLLHSSFLLVSSLISGGLVMVWLGAAWYVGTQHARAVKDGRTIV